MSSDPLPPGADELRPGSWAKAGQMTGLIAAVDGDSVTLFQPGDRQMTTVARSEVSAVPAGAVTVTCSAELTLPHGFNEDALKRWMASLADPMVRERAAEAMRAQGLDEAASLPEVHLEVRAAETSGAVCLCGARTPAPPGAGVACASCGRGAYARPVAPR